MEEAKKESDVSTRIRVRVENGGRNKGKDMEVRKKFGEEE
jgi:hypothetical protein